MHSPKTLTEAVARTCSVKKVFLKISQNLNENTCARVSFLSLRPATLLKERLWHRCFLVNFVKLLRGTIFIEQLWWLLLFLYGISLKMNVYPCFKGWKICKYAEKYGPETKLHIFSTNLLNQYEIMFYCDFTCYVIYSTK